MATELDRRLTIAVSESRFYSPYFYRGTKEPPQSVTAILRARSSR